MLPAQLLDWNQAEAEIPRTRTIADCFADQAARTPEAVALIAADRRLTYRQLDERSNQLARRLQGRGVRPETLVGVAMGRTETLVVSLLAILKAGAAYVPLDTTFPRERLALVMEDSGMPVLLTTARSRARFPFEDGRVQVIDAEDAAIALETSAAIAPAAQPENLAYVIYTSGSTGKPKGVMVEHRNVVNFFTGMDRAIGCTPGVWLAVTSVSFDISVLELLWTITRGFTVVLHDEDGAATIAEELVRHGVTHLQMTPSLARMLTLDPRAFAALGGLKQMLLGGEAVPAALIHHLRQVFRGEMHNMYGPTETTIWSTTCPVGEVGSFVSIGKPIANTQVFLLDPEKKPVAIGETGELYIGGDGVARGYWNRPELTAERFLEIPELSSARIYRTGDLARFLPDANIEFLGRADFQVKLRGHRIELGEIEALLEAQRGVRQAVVVLREDREGDQRLVAYLVADEFANREEDLKGPGLGRADDRMQTNSALAAEGTQIPPQGVSQGLQLTGISGEPNGAAQAVRLQGIEPRRLENTSTDSTAALRAALAAKLPEYMIPWSFVYLDAMPLTSNGKTDRKALLNLPPPPLAQAAAQPEEPPGNETERIVARVWQQALGLPSVGRTENFFDLGAHSLTVAEAHAKLQEAMGREIPLVDLFQYSNVSALARHLAGAQPAAAAGALSERAARRRMARRG
jgi:amino acid adenylation domain-containing protein